MRDTIYRESAIDALDKEYRCTDKSDDWDGLETAMLIIENLPSAQSEPSTEIQEILNYLDTTLHPIVSPDNWDVYAELYDMVSRLPFAQPESCEYYALCRHSRDEDRLRADLGVCDYCNEDSDGYVKPIERR